MLDFLKKVFLGFLGILSSVPSYLGYYLNFKTKSFISISGDDSRYIFDRDAIRKKTVYKIFEDLNPDCILSLSNKQRGFLTRGGALAFNNSVSIEGHDECTCLVEAFIASPDPDKVEPTFALDDNEISIETKYESQDIRGYVRYAVKVPRATFIKLIMNNCGNILVSSINNSIKKAQTQNGAITMQNIKGDVEAQTHNGSIHITSIKGDVEVQSSNGSIKIRDVIGKAKAASNNGSVAVDSISGNVFADSNNGKVSIASVDGDVKAQSSNGSIFLDTIAKNIYAKTNLGSVHHILGKYHKLGSIQAKTDLGSVRYLGQKVKKNFSINGDGEFKAHFVTDMGSIKILK